MSSAPGKSQHVPAAAAGGGGAGGDGPVPAPHGALSAAPHTGGAERRPAALSCQSAAGGTAAPHRTAAAPGGDRTAHSARTERLGGMEAPKGAPRTAAGNAARHPNPTAVPHSRPDPTRHRPQLPQHRSGHSSPWQPITPPSPPSPPLSPPRHPPFPIAPPLL